MHGFWKGVGSEVPWPAFQNDSGEEAQGVSLVKLQRTIHAKLVLDRKGKRAHGLLRHDAGGLLAVPENSSRV